MLESIDTILFQQNIHTFFNRYNTRSQMALDIPLRKTVLGQKRTSFLGPKIWPKINNDLKAVSTANLFIDTLKKEMLNNLIILKN